MVFFAVRYVLSDRLLDTLWKEAYQDKNQLAISQQRPIDQHHSLAKRLVELSHELYPLLNTVARIEGIELEREIQKWIGILKSYIESLEEIPLLSSMK